MSQGRHGRRGATGWVVVLVGLLVGGGWAAGAAWAGSAEAPALLVYPAYDVGGKLSQDQLVQVARVLSVAAKRSRAYEPQLYDRNISSVRLAVQDGRLLDRTTAQAFSPSDRNAVREALRIAYYVGAEAVLLSEVSEYAYTPQPEGAQVALKVALYRLADNMDLANAEPVSASALKAEAVFDRVEGKAAARAGLTGEGVLAEEAFGQAAGVVAHELFKVSVEEAAPVAAPAEMKRHRTPSWLVLIGVGLLAWLVSERSGSGALDAPTRAVMAPTASEVQLSWAAGGDRGVVGYRIYCATATRGRQQSGFRLIAQLDANTFAYVDMPAVPTGDDDWGYRYQVSANTASGAESKRADFTTFRGSLITAPGLPDRPQGLAGLPGDQSVQLNWIPNTEPFLASYRIYRASSVAGPFVKVAEVTGTAYADAGLENGVSYYYYLRAVGSNELESDPSVTISATPGGA